MLTEEANNIELKININKTKSMEINTQQTAILQINNSQIDVEIFTYLGSILTKTGGTEADTCSTIRKAQQAFSLLSPVLNSSQYFTQTKLRLFQTNVKSVLFYELYKIGKTWNQAKTIAQNRVRW